MNNVKTSNSDCTNRTVSVWTYGRISSIEKSSIFSGSQYSRELNIEALIQILIGSTNDILNPTSVFPEKCAEFQECTYERARLYAFLFTYKIRSASILQTRTPISRRIVKEIDVYAFEMEYGRRIYGRRNGFSRQPGFLLFF